MSLSLFPARVPIGRTTDSTGKLLDVLMTPEFSRALSDLLVRVGGSVALTNSELEALIEQQSVVPEGNFWRDVSAVLRSLAIEQGILGHVAALRKDLLALRTENESLRQILVPTADLRWRISDLERATVNVAPLTDWEHPGKIGAAAPNDGTFNVLRANGLAKVICDTPTSQVITTATFTTVTNWTERLDVGNNFVPATGVFTAPRTGTYLVTARMTFSSVAFSAVNQLAAVAVFKNAAQAGAGHLISQAAVTISGTIEPVVIPLSLTAGDTVSVKVFQNSGANASTQASNDSYLSIIELP